MYVYLFGILITGLFIGLDGHNIVKEQVLIKYNKWKSVNNMVSTKYKNKMIIIWISMKLILESMYINLLQYLNKSLIKIDKNNYSLTYVINGNLYKHRVRIKRGPRPLLQIIDDNSNDVTEVIIPYLGPEYNWHGNKLTPKVLGYKSLAFELSDGTEKICEESQILPSFD